MNEFLMEYQSYILFYMVGVVVNFIIGIFIVEVKLPAEIVLEPVSEV